MQALRSWLQTWLAIPADPTLQIRELRTLVMKTQLDQAALARKYLTPPTSPTISPAPSDKPASEPSTYDPHMGKL